MKAMDPCAVQGSARAPRVALRPGGRAGRWACLPLAGALLAGLVPVGGCASYRGEARTSPQAAVSDVPAPSGPLGFEQALALLPSRNPRLKALEAAAAGVNTAPRDAVLEAAGEWERRDWSHATLGTDLLSLLGVGAQPAQQALARAVREERLAQRLEVARSQARDLARAYAQLAVLQDPLPEPRLLDLEPYRRAGLLPASVWTEACATYAGWEAERQSAAVAQQRLRLQVLELLGCAPDAVLEPVLPPEGWPACPPEDARALLFARADLLRLAAAVQVADREARLMIARQWPTLAVGLGPTFDPLDPFGAVAVQWPLGAPAEARAALRRRDGAALELEAGVLAARHEAASARLALEASEAGLRFHRALYDGKHALTEAARTGAQVDRAELYMAVHLEAEELMAARELREARLACAEARVEAAFAAGWPGAVHAATSSRLPRAGQMRGSR